jgi:hypothetical protein
MKKQSGGLVPPLTTRMETRVTPGALTHQLGTHYILHVSCHVFSTCQYICTVYVTLLKSLLSVKKICCERFRKCCYICIHRYHRYLHTYIHRYLHRYLKWLTNESLSLSVMTISLGSMYIHMYQVIQRISLCLSKLAFLCKS